MIFWLIGICTISSKSCKQQQLIMQVTVSPDWMLKSKLERAERGCQQSTLHQL